MLKNSWERCAFREIAPLPRWEFARFENSNFVKRIGPKVLNGISNWSGETSAIASAETGSGKTAMMVAWLHRKLTKCEAQVQAGAGAAPRMDFAFISGPALSGCRRRSKIGDESPLVELAASTRLLILDELGFEPICEELLHVVDTRHKLQRPTAVTTGLTLDGFVGRYGGSLFRKLTEGGSVIEGWK
ncbi:MAG: hypothetical protein ABI488_23605 [Polyangiaceae bacterium]